MTTIYGRGHNFYPRPPRGGRRSCRPHSQTGSAISIHALREEGDRHWHIGQSRTLQFLSTPSARRATAPDLWNICATWYFYPRPPRGGRPISSNSRAQKPDFYPRPPRGGRLCQGIQQGNTRVNFYPRPPRGGRLRVRLSRHPGKQFLSTPSARRATSAAGAPPFAE